MSSKVRSRTASRAISRIAVSGFKSIHTKQAIEIRPLTILAGANSSGKTSLMQPVLLLKQTLEAPYDPGALLIRGPNVEFSEAKQMFFKSLGSPKPDCIEVELHVDKDRISLAYSDVKKQGQGPVEIVSQTDTTGDREVTLTYDMDGDKLVDQFSDDPFVKALTQRLKYVLSGSVTRNRCFLEARLFRELDQATDSGITVGRSNAFTPLLEGIIHLPGLRGNPERIYPLSAVGKTFPGTFQNYVASVILHWAEGSNENVEQLGRDLSALGLTWKVEARSVDDTRVELRVGRLSTRPRKGGARDLVSIADVGFGVSQTLPVVVALLAAGPGQMVFIEQPEIHLHPRAQVAMATLLAKAAQRGVRVVVETHSSLLLLGVQSLVAEGTLTASDVALHWFLRDPESGITTVRSAELDEAGRFGDWPEDFGEVALEADSRYLSAAEARIVGR
jgi:hypothetical protein